MIEMTDRMLSVKRCCSTNIRKMPSSGQRKSITTFLQMTILIVKCKDKKEHGEYRTRRRTLETYDPIPQCLATSIEYRSTFNPTPGLPCDAKSNFIPVEMWDKSEWAKHIHQKNKGV
ncbi:MAG: hypothetical protein PHC50_10235 [Candidatus Cloacimonetes bacterium]|nr:hypothetical protein [Candidatus Cloacimonadota bacterium]